jgi:hypothetical protein
MLIAFSVFQSRPGAESDRIVLLALAARERPKAADTDRFDA